MMEEIQKVRKATKNKMVDMLIEYRETMNKRLKGSQKQKGVKKN